MPLSASDFSKPEGEGSCGPTTVAGRGLLDGAAEPRQIATGLSSSPSEFAPQAGEVSPSASPAPPESPDNPYGVATSLTPSGLEVYFQAGPKRIYRVRHVQQPESDGATGFQTEWVDVPSVTTVLGVLDKPALVWWGQRIGVEGVMELIATNAVWQINDIESYLETGPSASLSEGRHPATAEEIVDLLTKHKLTVNHQRDKAATRGINVHAAFEQWAEDQRITPQPTVFPEHEQGYVQGLASFLQAVTAGEPIDIQAEIMVGSLKRRFAGRYDVRLTLQKPCEVVTKIYPKKPPVVETIPAGRHMWDVKTSSGIYPTHFLQLEGYEGASVEDGYEPTDYRGVIHVTADGRYELQLNQTKHEQPWTYDDFLAVRDLYRVMKEVKR